MHDDPDFPECAPLTLRQAALAMPAAMAFAALTHASQAARVFLGGARIPLHELGHAVLAWLCGYSAVPIPFGVTLRSAERSFVVWAVVAGALGYGLFRLLRARALGWAAFAGGLLLAQTICTWATREHTRELLITFGGSAGELVLPALLLVLFHQTLPHRLRWDLARWIALVIAAFILVQQTLTWRAARMDHDLIPWGSVMGEDGDMQRLEGDHGWGPSVIIARYVRTAHLSLALAFGAWLHRVVQAWREGEA